MIHQNIQQHFQALRLHGMATAYTELEEQPGTRNMSFDERLVFLLEREEIIRDNRGIERRFKRAKLKFNAALEETTITPARGLKTDKKLELSHCKWIDKKQNIVITGATGSGKTWLACALAQKGIREGFTAMYIRLPRFLEQCLIARSDNEYIKAITKIGKVDVLILDDWGLTALNDIQRKDILEIIEERYQCASTIILSQLPVKNWHEIIGEQMIADAILDRVIHNAHKIHLKGDSLRKKLD
jgi:DNA replication protein DnaC